MPIIPTVIDHTARGERASDIFSMLLQHRIVFLGDPIDDQTANVMIAQLQYLEYEDPERDIKLYINSPGGSITSGLAIYDTMQAIQPQVATFCVGMAASMAAILLAGGARGKRYALPSARIMIHQPWTPGVGGSISDMEIKTREFLRWRELTYRLLSKDTGQPIEKIQEDTDRDHFMSAEEALSYGLIDSIHKPEG
jgi:ATP-dependent Clp protease protease subunit